jgi:hypothetical protein
VLGWTLAWLLFLRQVGSRPPYTTLWQMSLVIMTRVQHVQADDLKYTAMDVSITDTYKGNGGQLPDSHYKLPSLYGSENNIYLT